MQAVAVMLVTEKGKGAQSNELEVHQKGARVLKEKENRGTPRQAPRTQNSREIWKV